MKKWILIGILVIVGVPAISYAVVLIFRPAQTAVIITDPNRAVYTYQQFFDMYAAAQSFSSQLKVAGDAVNTFKSDHASDLNSYANSTELSRLRSIQQGLTSQLISTVNTYNARAKDLTTTIFKDWRLPSGLVLDSNNNVLATY